MKKTVSAVALILCLVMVLSSCSPAVSDPSKTETAQTTGSNTTATSPETEEFVLPEYALSYDAKDVIFAPDDLLAFMNSDFVISSRVPNKTVRDYADGSVDKNAPNPIILAWKDSGAKEYTLYLSVTEDFQNALTYKSDKNEISITNLYTGAEYYWRVADENGNDVTPVYTFTTSAEQPRTVSVDGVKNFRDIGGFSSSLGAGAVVKQGMIYRSANLDSITEAGLVTFKDMLGIKTDLDLRTYDEGNHEAHAVAMLDDAGIKYYNASVVAYESIFNKKNPERVDEVRKAIALFADPDNYPIVFHCAIGTDRTGTIALLLQGLLGVDNVEVYKNYYLSWFAACISEDVDSRVNSFFQTYNKLSRYVSKDLSLAENTEAFLLSIGVTQEEIDSIRSIMIEYPEE